LAAVVIHQTITMVAAVVFESQALSAVKQVRTGYFVALIVVDGALNFRPWESGKYEEHPQPRFHWGLGLRFGKVDNSPKTSDSFGSPMLGDIRAKLGDGDQLGMKDQVRGDDSLS